MSMACKPECKWHVPFRERGTSASQTLNFLWQYDRVYLMDNHLAALWCWLRHVSPDGPTSVFHIDRHYDALPLPPDLAGMTPARVASMEISDYLGERRVDRNQSVPVFRWDNYFSVFLNHSASESRCRCVAATHKKGDRPPDCCLQELETWDLQHNVEFFLRPSGQWIVNLDLDYFFCRANGDRTIRFQSEEYVDEEFQAIAASYRDKAMAVLTVSLSPECCGGWEESEKLCRRFFEAMALPYPLPPVDRQGGG